MAAISSASLLSQTPLALSGQATLSAVQGPRLSCPIVASSRATRTLNGSYKSQLRQGHLIQLPCALLGRKLQPRHYTRASRISSPRPLGIRASSESESSVGPAGLAAIGFGLIGVPVVAWSLFTLKTTGCGLPPGPGGALGGLEGISYLAIVGVVGWSLYTKVKTGSGLPQGPFGLLGAVEGLSYLVLLAGIVVFGFQIADYGFIPPPTPGGQCFG